MINILEFEDTEGVKTVGIYPNWSNYQHSIEDLLEIVETIVDQKPYLGSSIVFECEKIEVQINESIEMKKLLKAIKDRISERKRKKYHIEVVRQVVKEINEYLTRDQHEELNKHGFVHDYVEK